MTNVAEYELDEPNALYWRQARPPRKDTTVEETTVDIENDVVYDIFVGELETKVGEDREEFVKEVIKAAQEEVVEEYDNTAQAAADSLETIYNSLEIKE